MYEIIIGFIVIFTILALSYINTDKYIDLVPQKTPNNEAYDGLKSYLSYLRMNKMLHNSLENDNLIVLLEDFIRWMDAHPVQINRLNMVPEDVITKYYNDANPSLNLKFIQTGVDMEKIYDTLLSLSTKESYQNYQPGVVQRFDEWVNDDFPRQKLFNMAMSVDRNLAVKMKVEELINEFMSTTNVPKPDAERIKKEIRDYLQV